MESFGQDMTRAPERTCYRCNRITTTTTVTTTHAPLPQQDTNEIENPNNNSQCAECQMVFYCSKKCRDADLKNHQIDCVKLSSYKLIFSTVCSHKFTYTEEVTSELFDGRALVEFLKKEGVYNQGMWMRETPWSIQHSLPAYGELDAGPDPYVLPVESTILEDMTIAPPMEPLTCWEDYYKWRGFHQSSPIAIILHHVMTVYHIVQMSRVSHLSHIDIVVAGVEKEADLTLTYKELSALLPGKTISIAMVGPLISTRVSDTRVEYGGVTITRRCASLQDYLGVAASRPHLVVCANAGLAAYTSWREAVEEVMRQKLKCYVTDYCLLSLDMSRQVVAGLQAVKLSDFWVNPFRDPKRKFCDSARLAWFSNAFICELVTSV